MSKGTAPNLLPAPRLLKGRPGSFLLPRRPTLQLDDALAPNMARWCARHLSSANPAIHSAWVLADGSSPPAIRASQSLNPGFAAGAAAAEEYVITIDRHGVRLEYGEPGGLRAALATMRQLLRQYGRRLPCLQIRDWPDFARRGVMLDVSRGRVPRLDTLLDLAARLADFKINELQLYTEHTFAFRRYQSVWQGWGALTGAQIRKLDARCRELGIDLVPNQNSFGHLRWFLADPRLKKLAEIQKPYADASGEFIRRPTTLAPKHPGTLPFLRGLYDELLPNFSSGFFNIGGDETWDLGRGQSKKLCEARGQGRVYLDFLKQIQREVARRGRRMMFWGDIILKHPALIHELSALAPAASRVGPPAAPRVAAEPIIALNWGYEANHPFAREAAQFAKARLPFYVCPGTSTWQTLIGRHDNALANLRAAARAGRRQGARGFLITDWGDGGHPQPLAVSWPMFAAGAALAWNSKARDERTLVPVLNRDVFDDPAGRAAAAAFKLGFAHLLLGVKALNETPLGTVIAAPRPEEHELFCRNGLKWFAKIPAKNIRMAWREIQAQRRNLRRARLNSDSGKILAEELDLAARMAAQSCRFMLWQQAAAAGKKAATRQLARSGIRELRQLRRDFRRYWPKRNQATPRHCSAFLQWRIHDYRGSL